MTDATGENSGNCKNGKSDEGGKSGKLQPKLRFKGFTDAWEQRALGELATFAKGAGYSKSDLVGKGKPIILYGRLYTDYQTIIHDVNTFVIDRPGSIYSVGNEVIVPASGETAEDIARASVVCRAGIILGGDLNIIYPKPSLSSVFLALVISNGKEHVKLARKAQGKSIVHIHNNDLKYIRISYPDIREQMTVSHLFRCFDCLIAAAERKVCLLKKKKHAYLNHIFTQHLRFTGHTTPWHQQAFKELVSRQSKTNGFSLLPTVEYEDIIPGEGRLNKNIYKKKKGKHGVLFQQGDILFGKLRPYLKNWVFAEFDGIAVGDFWVLRRLTGMNNRFLFFLIQSPSFEAVSSLSTGTKMPRADWNLVSNTLFSIPTEQTEQTEIARFFQTLDSLIAAAERKVSLLKKRKQAYLQKMFV